MEKEYKQAKKILKVLKNLRLPNKKIEQERKEKIKLLENEIKKYEKENKI